LAFLIACLILFGCKITSFIHISLDSYRHLWLTTILQKRLTLNLVPCMGDSLEKWALFLPHFHGWFPCDLATWIRSMKDKYIYYYGTPNFRRYFH
jgi:hypothetical protein